MNRPETFSKVCFSCHDLCLCPARHFGEMILICLIGLCLHCDNHSVTSSISPRTTPSPSPRPRWQLTAPRIYSYINLYCDLTFANPSWHKHGGWGRLTFLLSPYSRYPIKVIFYYSVCHLFLYLSQGIQQFIFFPTEAWAVGKNR